MCVRGYYALPLDFFSFFLKTHNGYRNEKMPADPESCQCGEHHTL